MSAADLAVTHLLRRIKDDPRLAYYFLHTESLALLCAAHAETASVEPVTFKRDFEAACSTEPPRCRSGECVGREAA